MSKTKDLEKELQKEISDISDVSVDKNIKSLESEKEVSEHLKLALEAYKQQYAIVTKQYLFLAKLKTTFPEKYIEKDDFEDLLLKAAQAKHKCIQGWKNAAGISSSIDIDIDYYEAQLKIYIADEQLSDKFDKITEALRDAYVNSVDEMRQLKKLGKKLDILSEACEKLVKSFENDEVNFRRYMDKKNKFSGSFHS